MGGAPIPLGRRCKNGVSLGPGWVGVQLYLATPPFVWAYLVDRRLGYALASAALLGMLALRAYLVVATGADALCTFNVDDPVMDCYLSPEVRFE